MSVVVVGGGLIFIIGYCRNIRFGNGVVGKAFKGTMCSYDFSGGVDVVSFISFLNSCMQIWIYINRIRHPNLHIILETVAICLGSQ